MKCDACQRDITNLSNFTCPNFHCTLPGVTKHVSESQERPLEANRRSVPCCPIDGECDLPDAEVEEIFTPDRKFGYE